MICPRCGDGLVEDRFMDWTARWRCLECGHVQDSLSVEGLPMGQEKGRVIETAEPNYWDEEVHLGSESFIGLSVTSRYHRDDRKLQPRRSKHTPTRKARANPSARSIGKAF